ncbi:MAG: hypothetical protein KGZ62_08755 [Sulfurimonas sp.]|nr:hypothetical protein [Sulfurimonas sp.]
MNEYNTNIVKLTCSCPDWKETRQQYKLNDPRRLCKHIINKLDVNNLPLEISKFKESIEFYQEKEWGFKRNFDKIFTLKDLTLLDSLDWIDIYDEDGNHYSYLFDTMTKNSVWRENKKPINYKIVENHYLSEYEKEIASYPEELHIKEIDNIITFLKDKYPKKENYYLYIEKEDNWTDGKSHYISYQIEESRISKKEENTLRNEFDQENPIYDNEKYSSFFDNLYKMKSKDLDYNESVRYLDVEHYSISITMNSGEKYNIKRDLNFINQIIHNRKEYGREKVLKEQERLDNEKQKYEEELEQKRKIAKKKGYILAQDYEGKQYDIQSIYNHPYELSWDEYEKIKNSILGNYDTLQHLIKEYSLNISTSKFNKALKYLNFIAKDSSLNQNDWIIKDDGLKYGINLIIDSKYMHESIPDWYEVHIFDNTKMKLVSLNSTINIKMSSALFKKDKFEELYQLVKKQIDAEQSNTTTKQLSNKQLEREKWLRHVECPNCGEKTNIHKKDKRKHKTGYIQRFYCNACNSMFQLDLEKLEQMMKDYEEDELNKEKFISIQKETDIQSFEKEVQAVKTSQEKNLFKRFFSFFE